ncbi:uncharacterized protein C5orf49 homolog [Erpetoichthys calabaricus]|uniref:Cilia and flagella associated protein 90 n=1 Tax=Erpetoichthys calabaricus TaxID=27687 RepID=A0A8C4XB07_ERPCA|nr:uncharacterized protein C5orf49 homolog [Erpetoichthys calabaricus]
MEQTTSETHMLDNAPISSMSSFSYIPPVRKYSKELSYFNTEGKGQHISAFDCHFRKSEGYNEKLHRDDREHAKSRGLDVHSEEMSRPVPVLSSSDYGRHQAYALDKTDRQHVRVGYVRSEFYRKNGIYHSVEEGYGSVFPA